MQIPLSIRHAHMPSFDNFMVGDNALMLAQLQYISPANPPPQPLYLWGPSGTGKTHLLQALHSLWEQNQTGLVCHLLPEFLDPETVPDWMDDPAWNLLLLDACETYGEREQQAAFALFIEASSRGASIIAAGRLPPIDLPLRDDLRTRLAWGLVLPVLPLKDAHAGMALHAEAKRRGLILSEDVVSYLLTHFPRNLKQLMTLLDRLDHFALIHKRSLTVPLLKQMLLEAPFESINRNEPVSF